MKGFQTRKRWRKSSLKTEFRQKLKLFRQILGRQWTVVKRVVVEVLCLHFIAYAKVYGEAVQQLIVFRILLIHRMILRRPLTSAASHFSSTVTDEIGLFNDHQKPQENADSSDDAADDEEVNSNPVGQSQQYPGQEKVKTFLKNHRSQKLSTRMGAESQVLQFAKEDLNLKRKLLEQLEKLDADFNQNIAKVGRTMDTISNVTQQCLGVLGNLVKGPQHYGQFHHNFVQHDPLLHLQNQGDFFNNFLNHNEQYREKGGINKT